MNFKVKTGTQTRESGRSEGNQDQLRLCLQPGKPLALQLKAAWLQGASLQTTAGLYQNKIRGYFQPQSENSTALLPAKAIL